jgi:hypothetical protein
MALATVVERLARRAGIAVAFRFVSETRGDERPPAATVLGVYISCVCRKGMNLI